MYLIVAKFQFVRFLHLNSFYETTTSPTCKSQEWHRDDICEYFCVFLYLFSVIKLFILYYIIQLTRLRILLNLFSVFTKPQIEVVLTLENTSDCRTMWEVEKEVDQQTIITRKEVETDVNSALFIKAGGVSHKVSSLKYGRRVILKFVYVADDGEILRDAIKHTQQFFGSKSKEKKKKKKR